MVALLAAIKTQANKFVLMELILQVVLALLMLHLKNEPLRFGDKNNAILDKALIFGRNLIEADINNIYTNYIKFLTLKINESSWQEITSSRAMDYTIEFLATDYACPLSKDDLA